MNEVAELLKGIGALGGLAWPIATLVIVIITITVFRKEVAELLARSERLKIFGQGIELGKKLEELQTAAEAAAEEVGKQAVEPETAKKIVEDIGAENEFTAEILREATTSPKTALIRLAAAIETELRQLAAGMGYLNLARLPLPRAIEEFQKRNQLPPNVIHSVAAFYDVRNRVVHGVQANDTDAIRALDAGLTVLKAIRAIPHEINEVYHPGVPVYADKDCTQERSGMKGVILKTISPGGASITMRIFPTTRSYQRGEMLSWEWNPGRSWPESWYKDPDTGELKNAWGSSAEFIGRNLDAI